MQVALWGAISGSIALSSVALAQPTSSYRIRSDTPGCSNRETMERFAQIEGSGNRAAKMRADFLRMRLIRGECHILPAGIEVYIGKGSQLSDSLICVRPKEQTECIWMMSNALER
jgi:hypothetical protein